MSEYNFDINIHCTFSQVFFLQTFLTKIQPPTDVTVSKKLLRPSN